MIALTPRQADALRFIAGHIEAQGFAPTYDEIADGIGVSGRSAAFRLVNGLEERGAIHRGCLPRSISLPEPVAIPRAPDGAPLFAVRIPALGEGAA